MPGGDGTGPWGTFRNCVPQETVLPRWRGRRGRGRFFAAVQDQPFENVPADNSGDLEQKISRLEEEIRSLKELIQRK